MTHVFCKKPTREIFQKFLECYNCRDITKHPIYLQPWHITFYETAKKLDLIKDELCPFYYHHKFIEYFNDITLKKCIMMLRQWLKLFNYTLVTKSDFRQGKNTLTYMSLNNTNLTKIL
jgi:hypothetical protein